MRKSRRPLNTLWRRRGMHEPQLYACCDVGPGLIRISNLFSPSPCAQLIVIAQFSIRKAHCCAIVFITGFTPYPLTISSLAESDESFPLTAITFQNKCWSQTNHNNYTEAIIVCTCQSVFVVTWCCNPCVQTKRQNAEWAAAVWSQFYVCHCWRGILVLYY